MRARVLVTALVAAVVVSTSSEASGWDTLTPTQRFFSDLIPWLLIVFGPLVPFLIFLGLPVAVWVIAGFCRTVARRLKSSLKRVSEGRA